MQLNRPLRVGHVRAFPVYALFHFMLALWGWGGLSAASLGSEFPVMAGVVGLPGPTALVGELGAKLDRLNRYYSPPQGPSESNQLFDLWEGAKLSLYVRQAGLTNNHALIVNSHARATLARWRIHFAMYPHESRLRPGEKPFYFTARDLAAFLGPEASAQVHNVLLAGCDLRGGFNTREWRENFVNATNIMHAPAGDAGYQPMFLQVLFSDSKQIQPIYETPVRNASGKKVFFLESQPSIRATRLSPYVADLFRPGEAGAFRRQQAGRELLAPVSSPRDLDLAALPVLRDSGRMP
jgi:hypothetical protein